MNGVEDGFMNDNGSYGFEHRDPLRAIGAAWLSHEITDATNQTLRYGKQAEAALRQFEVHGYGLLCTERPCPLCTTAARRLRESLSCLESWGARQYALRDVLENAG